MAGGEGTRLRPLTSYQPKPMLPLGNVPMMEHVVNLLRRHGIEDIVVTVAFLANAVRTYFGDGSEFGVRMHYATEETPLGTAGSVRNAAEELDDRFIVISGDVLTDIDLTAIVKFHEERDALVTIGLKAMENPLEFGIVITNQDGAVERFLEKPGWGQVFSDTVNTGIYVMEPEIFRHIDPSRPVDFSGEVFPALLAQSKPVYGYPATGYWNDVGSLGPYISAHADLLDGKVDAQLAGFEMRPGVRIGEGSEIDPSVIIDPPVLVGSNCRVEADAHLGAYTVLGANVRVGRDCRLERAVVHDNAHLAQGVHLRGCVVGRSSDLRNGAFCDEESVLGDECFVGKGAVVNRGVKIYPYKTVEAGAVVNSSIIWESAATRSLFGGLGVTGLANVDVTPELATRVAMAYGTTLRKGATVVTSRDSSRSARMLKRAIMAGLNAAGISVDDLEVATVPLHQFLVRNSACQGGIAVHLDPNDPQSVVIRIFAQEGGDIDEGTRRKIERLFYREDFRRASAGEIGDISFPPRIVELYTAALVDSVDIVAVRERGFKIVLDYAYGAASFVMPNVLSKLGADVLAINPYGSTVGAIAFDGTQHAARVAELVRSSGADLGAVVHPLGEAVSLIDETGHLLDRHEAMAVFTQLVVTTQEKARIGLPVSASEHLVAACRDAGASIVWSNLSATGTVEAAARGEVDFGASHDGRFIFPIFQPTFDGSATLVHLLSLLAISGSGLADVARSLPKAHLCHRTVITPWEQKGMIMRTMVETNQDRDLVLVDGVKVPLEDGWVLVVPDPDEPVTHVWAEGSDDRAATRLAETFARRIEDLLA